MAYLSPHFEVDVFVSYSHGDPHGRGDAPLKQWTLGLIQKLERELLSIDPEFAEVLLWRDEHIDPTMHLTPALRGQVSASCILLIVMSNYYLASSWCKDEATWFAEQIRERDSGRVFVLRAQPTDVSKWPEFLRDERGHAMPGFQFCAADAEVPYGWPDFVVQNEDFRKEMSRLLTALARRLREFKKRLPPPPTMGPATLFAATAVNPSRVYLHATREQAAAREEIRLALEQDGLKPVTQGGAAGGGDFGQEERSLRLKMVKRCDALALIGGDGGDQDQNEFFQVCVDERKEMETAHGAPLPCVVLDRSGGKLSFVTGWDAAYIDATRDNWRGEMRDWFTHAAAQSASAAT